MPTPDFSPVPGGPPAPAGPDLLVVEDDKSLRKLMEVVLEMEGFRLLVAASAEEALALEAACEGPLRGLVTDLSLPGLPGTALAARMAERRPGIRILYVSGHQGAPADWGGPEGAWLRKPFTGSELVAAARRLVSGGAGDEAQAAQGRNSTRPSSRS